MLWLYLHLKTTLFSLWTISRLISHRILSLKKKTTYTGKAIQSGFATDEDDGTDGMSVELRISNLMRLLRRYAISQRAGEQNCMTKSFTKFTETLEHSTIWKKACRSWCTVCNRTQNFVQCRRIGTSPSAERFYPILHLPWRRKLIICPIPTIQVTN